MNDKALSVLFHSGHTGQCIQFSRSQVSPDCNDDSAVNREVANQILRCVQSYDTSPVHDGDAIA